MSDTPSTPQPEGYYEQRCREMDRQLCEMKARFRGALSDVRRAKITTTLIRKLYQLDALKLEADDLASSFVELVSNALGVPRAALLRRAEDGDGFDCVRAHGFAPPQARLLSAAGTREGFVFGGSIDADLELVSQVRALTGANHFVWCYSRVSRLGLLLANGVDNHHDDWQFSIGDEPLVESVLDVASSVMERARVEKQLAHSAFHDSLTGLPNRGFLLRHLDACVRRSARTARDVSAVMFIDVDRFKWVNDTLGHQAGDKLLSALAQRLRSVVRPGDLVARLSGDEFAVLAESLGTMGDAEALARRILEALATPFRIHGHSVYASVSLGLAEARPEHSDAADFLRDADIAMYHAKQRGGACYEIYGAQMRSGAISELRLRSDLKEALQREELSLYYQPVFDAHTGRIVCLEALLRWHHPREGLLTPEQFIAALDKSGLAGELGDWVLQRVGRDLKLWRSETDGAVDPTVCINIAQSQFVHAEFVSSLASTMQTYGVAPEQIRLELTETTLLDCRRIDEAVLEQLREMGVRIMLDDFGTGYSSLSRLHSLPIDSVKVDRQLVRPVAEGDATVIRAIFALAQQLGLQVVAPGVETMTQLNALRKLGCDAVQGFFLGRPMAASQLGEYVLTHEAALESVSSSEGSSTGPEILDA
ncbi:MAG: EAL domain-containing protein [Pseudomonadota bacterium]